MNARHFVKMSVVVLLLLPAGVFAQTITRGQGLPDLQPLGLRLDKECRVVVIIRNNGPGIVPEGGYTHGVFPDVSAVQMFKGGAPYGWVQLGTLDPSHLTQPVGGVVSYPWLADPLPPGTHVVKVDVDSNNFIAESNELNNSLTEKLTCLLPLPDLQPVDMTLDADCRIDVTIRNNGPATVPEAGYSLSPPGSSGVQMYNDAAPWGGIVLGGFDPLPHGSQPVGGTKTFKWFSSLPLPAGAHTVKVDVDNNNSISETNEGNNSLTKTLNCQKPLPDLVPTNISLQPSGISVNSPCQIVITLQNIGTGAIPDAAFVHTAAGSGVQMYKNGAGWGGIILVGIDPSKTLQPAGSTLTVPWYPGTPNLLLAPGTYTLKLDVDNTNTFVESNEANNSLTKTVTCGLVLQTNQP